MRLAAGVLLTLASGACQPEDAVPPASPPPPPPMAVPPPGADDVIVDASWLRAHLDDPTSRVVDARGERAFALGRITGARNVTPESIETVVAGVRSELVARETFQETLSEAGVEPGGTLVVYGDDTGMPAARVAWSLLAYGHPDVRILDGGIAAWIALGAPMDTDPPAARRSSYVAAERDAAVVAAVDRVRAHLGDGTTAILDVRSLGEHESGHIPGDRHVDWQQNLDDGRVRARDELEPLYAGMDRDAPVIVYCWIGWRASVGFYVLRSLGFRDVRVYDGSWAEWGSRSDLPREP